MTPRLRAAATALVATLALSGSAALVVAQGGTASADHPNPPGQGHDCDKPGERKGHTECQTPTGSPSVSPTVPVPTATVTVTATNPTVTATVTSTPTVNPTLPVPTVTVTLPPLCNLIIGTRQADRLVGTVNRDCIVAHAGDDRLFGGPNNDRLFGGRGDDVLRGGPVAPGGRNILRGGLGSDLCIGAPGDKFISCERERTR